MGAKKCCKHSGYTFAIHKIILYNKDGCFTRSPSSSHTYLSAISLLRIPTTWICPLLYDTSKRFMHRCKIKFVVPVFWMCTAPCTHTYEIHARSPPSTHKSLKYTITDRIAPLTIINIFFQRFEVELICFCCRCCWWWSWFFNRWILCFVSKCQRVLGCWNE